MRNQARKDGLSRRRNKSVAMNDGGCRRTIWTPFSRSTKLWIAAGELTAFCHAHHAMVLTVAAATCRQVRLAPRIQRKERLDKRQAQKSQQRNGEKFPQCSYSSIAPSVRANSARFRRGDQLCRPFINLRHKASTHRAFLTISTQQTKPLPATAGTLIPRLSREGKAVPLHA